MILSQDFREFIELLHEHNVKYLIVGGYAVSVHGYPRYTGDLDIWIKPTPENGQSMTSVMEAFGFGGQGLKIEDFTKPESIIQLGYPPFRIDILTSLDGVTFDECYKDRQSVDVDTLRVDFIGLRDLRKNKEACGRSRDKDDLEHLT